MPLFSFGSSREVLSRVVCFVQLLSLSVLCMFFITLTAHLVPWGIVESSSTTGNYNVVKLIFQLIIVTYIRSILCCFTYENAWPEKATQNIISLNRLRWLLLMKVTVAWYFKHCFVISLTVLFYALIWLRNGLWTFVHFPLLCCGSTSLFQTGNPGSGM